jgi:V8-like Glu-specific endopeptidase
VEDVEKAVTKIHRFVKKIPQSAFLPDFGREAVVACWQLTVPKSTTSQAPSQPERSFQTSSISQLFRETKLDFHPREKIRPGELEHGGKYRGKLIEFYSVRRISHIWINNYPGVCKLSMEFQEGTKMVTYGGSGWLIDESTVVTASHNLYDPVEKHFARGVTVYIGITNGKKENDRVEKRAGQFVAVHWGYFAASLRQNDMAVIKLQSGFDHVTPIHCKDAAVKGNIHLEVVGYPGDMGVKGKNKGWVMYRSHGDYRYDLVEDEYLLHHNCDTYPGW